MNGIVDDKTLFNLTDGPSGEYMLQHFRLDHLPTFLREVSHHFAQLAVWIVSTQERSPERTVALRKLLESKDAAVRNAIYTKEVHDGQRKPGGH